MIRPATMALLCACLLLGVAAPAAAQLSLGPIVGVLTGHVGTATGTDGEGTTLSGGLSVAVVEQTGWGVEFDAGFAGGDAEDGGLSAQSYMLNVVGVWPKGRLRPFGTFGGGAIRATTCTASCAGTLTWAQGALSAGGGVQYLLNETFGFRGEARYFSTVGDHPDPVRDGVQFWRISAGATFLWSAQ
jgi:Outer membrane protein beta-barrel domain